jgi:outer membrane biosynthesis protein TonB
MEAGSRSPRQLSHTIRGIALSLAMHGAVVLLLLSMWTYLQSSPAPRDPQPIPVDLVELGDETASPDADKSKLPQQRAPEIGEHPTPQAVPVPKQAAPVPAPGKTVTTKDKDPARPQPDPHRPPSPQPQDGAGISNTITGADGKLGRTATYGVKDYVRAQIERRWYPQGSALLRNDWVVQLHLRLNEDGSVGQAEIVDGGKMGDLAYRDFAFSVRNAALLSAPFTLPSGLDEAARDMTLDFNPRRVQQ